MKNLILASAITLLTPMAMADFSLDLMTGSSVNNGDDKSEFFVMPSKY